MLRCCGASRQVGKTLQGSRAFCSSGSSRIDFGKHSGLTFEECRRDHPSYCEWLVKQPESSRTDALRAFIASNPSQAAAGGTKGKGKGQSSFAAKSGDWTCSCGANVFASKSTCYKCGKSRSGGAVEAPRAEKPTHGQSVPSTSSNGGLTLDFGKHSGMTFEDCQRDHPDYGVWILKQPPHPKTAAFREFVEGTKASPSSPAQRSSGGWSGQVKAVGTPPASSSSDAVHKPKTFAAQGNPGAKVGGNNTGGFGKPAFVIKVEDDNTVMSGMKSLGFGKHAENTWAEVFENEPNYCNWLVDSSMASTKSSGGSWAFIAYVLHRRLVGGSLTPTKVSVTAQKNCLFGCSFAITGTLVEMPRPFFEELIIFFGGRVVTAVSSNTNYLIVGGSALFKVESCAKYSKAKQLDIPTVTVAQVLEDLRETCEDLDQGDMRTFTSGGNAQEGNEPE